MFVFGVFPFFSFHFLSFILSALSHLPHVCAEALNHRIIVKNEVEKECYSIQIEIQGSNNWVIVEI
jgi:hypothetical protein